METWNIVFNAADYIAKSFHALAERKKIELKLRKK